MLVFLKKIVWLRGIVGRDVRYVFGWGVGED
jgi:hypothetical protein